jgi:hypothetical protein
MDDSLTSGIDAGMTLSALLAVTVNRWEEAYLYGMAVNKHALEKNKA